VAACGGGEATGDASCRTGYEEPVCTVCSSGYAVQSSTKTCVPCSHSAGLDISDILLLTIAALLVIVAALDFTQSEFYAKIKSIDDLVLILITKLKLIDLTVDERSKRSDPVLF
jgi:hypothetical protein